MPTFTVSSAHASRTYTSRRKRNRSSETRDILSSRAMVGLLGLLVVALIVSLGIIASQPEADTNTPSEFVLANGN
ncbi:hypothetical protein [Hymenobacter koreensis]|uniref:Uncharacterized protein n=1 Tax=Hymenobacter koreensis TaxID=1084523 RepID=A0ABP8JG36_9BACT